MAHESPKADRNNWLAELEKEQNRLRDVLEPYIGAERALETAELLFKDAVELDGIVDEIWNSPSTQERFDYDGQIFSPKGAVKGPKGIKLLNGVNFLRSLTDANIKGFFGGNKEGAGVDGMLAWIRKDVMDHARMRLGGFRSNGSL